MRQTSRHILGSLPRPLRFPLLVILVPSAAFYLFGLPMLAATATRLDPLGAALGVFMLAQLLLFVGLAALEAAGSFYGFVPRLPRPFALAFRTLATPDRLSPGGGIIMMFASYLAFIYAYGVLYAFVSTLDPAAFQDRINGADAVYFSVITAATVGYGDIAPKTLLAKTIVASEILLSLLYVVLLFSAAGAALQRKAPISAGRPSELDK